MHKGKNDPDMVNPGSPGRNKTLASDAGGFVDVGSRYNHVLGVPLTVSARLPEVRQYPLSLISTPFAPKLGHTRGG